MGWRRGVVVVVVVVVEVAVPWVVLMLVRAGLLEQINDNMPTLFRFKIVRN